MKLTKTVCDKATYQGKGKKGFYAVWDGQLRGFGLRITPSGTKTFIVFYRIGGKQKILALGKYGILTVDQARKMAREILVEVTKGNDPVAERKAHESTFAELAARYMTDYSKVHKKSWREDQRRLDTRILPAFGKKAVISITRAEIIKFHQRMGEERGPYEANRLLALLSTMFEYARRIELIPFDHANPARLIEKFNERSRAVFMKKEDIPRLFEALDKDKNPYFIAFIKMVLFTAARKTELLCARWKNVDWDQRILWLEDTKNGEAYPIRLSKSAIAILNSLLLLSDGSGYIFPSTDEPGKRLWNVDRPWREVRKAAGLDDITIHDLRRSAASWLAQSGTPLQHIGAALNHKDRKTVEVYARLSDDPVRDAVDKLDEIISGNVIDIEKLRQSKKSDTA